MTTTVVGVLHSAHWDSAVVILTACGHRHVRPARRVPKQGDSFECPYDEHKMRCPHCDGSVRFTGEPLGYIGPVGGLLYAYAKLLEPDNRYVTREGGPIWMCDDCRKAGLKHQLRGDPASTAAGHGRHES
jgi:hypothetical protein